MNISDAWWDAYCRGNAVPDNELVLIERALRFLEESPGSYVSLVDENGVELHKLYDDGRQYYVV